MARYIEYEKKTGRIISEVISDTQPETSGNCALLEINDDLQIDTSLYAVKDGQLVKAQESISERLEREELSKQHLENTRKRMKSLGWECIMAILDNNDEAVKECQNEFKKLKAFIL